MKPRFARNDKVTHRGERGHVEGFDEIAGTFTITLSGGRVVAALGVDLELAEPRKARPPKHAR